MSVITYSAKREIEKTGFFASGLDISADTVDDSYNSVSSDLSGVADDEWVNVAGFSDPANNGWFQANGTSTITKIIQDTADLVAEAAGNVVTVQGYKRGLGQAYEIEFGAERLDRRVDITRKQHRSIGGQTETLLHRNDVKWMCQTDILEQSDLPQWYEFIHSVEGGETFTFDPYGAVATPDESLPVILASQSIREVRVGSTKKYRFMFEVLVL